MESIVNSEKNTGVFVFSGIEEMSGVFYKLLMDEYTNALSENKTYHLALSGGNTPVKLFEYIARIHQEKINWNFLHLYWGDERCVLPDDPESNYGNLWNTIIRYIDIPEENIHRMKGEADPEEESKRYSEVLRNAVPSRNGFPRFDLILLGIGEDGHTASLFPDAMELLDTDEWCYVAVHPQSKQKRLTVSLKLINNSRKIIFLATGSTKAGIIAKIIKKKEGFELFPASHVNPLNGKLEWFLDSYAGRKLRKRFLSF
jgi:6-phosphogluconolactonase